MLQEIKNYYKLTKHNFSVIENKIKNYKPPFSWVYIFTKEYPRFKTMPLKVSSKFSHKNSNFIKLVENRTTTRKFSAKKEMTFKELSTLLYFSAGIKSISKLSKEEIHNPKKSKRFYPSGGARYPIELYVVVNKVRDLKNGIYHYSVAKNSLELILEKDLRNDMKLMLNSDMGSKSSMIIILTSIILRSEIKYLTNAYSFSCLEAGHIGQNLYLLSAALNIGCCAIGGFWNDKIENILDINGNEEIPLYVFAIGKR